MLSNAVDRSISKIDFRPLAGRTVYLDTTYLRSVKNNHFVNAEYVTSALRQQVVASGCLIQDAPAEAEIIIEARIGTLGSDDHRMIYGVPENNGLSSAASVLPNSPPLPAIPEISLARRESREGAAKIAAFAYDRETRAAVWQSGLSESISTARDTWVLGAGPIRTGSIRRETKIGSTRLFRFRRRPEPAALPSSAFDRPAVDYASETHFQDGMPILAGEPLQKSLVKELDDAIGEAVSEGEPRVAELPSPKTP